MRGCSLLLVAMVVGWPFPASAQAIVVAHTLQALTWCDEDEAIYTVASTGAPAIVARSFAGRGKEVSFRTCRDRDGNTHYFVRKPRPNRNGVCRVVEDEVFPSDPSDFVIADMLYDGTAPGWYFDLQGWTSRPPHAWSEMDYRARHTSLALVTDVGAPCPSTDSAGYIPVSGTDGLVRTFVMRWRTITTNPEDFEQALADVPVLQVPDFPPDDPQRARKALRMAVFDRRQEIAEIECGNQELSADGECYALIGDFAVFFDVTEHGLQITGIRENPIT